MLRAMRNHNRTVTNDGAWGTAMAVVTLAMVIVVLGALL